MRFKAFYGHLAAALAGVVIFHFGWREVTFKLADQVLVFADGAGFRELASEHPWGAIDWVVRLLAATNIAGWGILVQLALVAAASTLAYLALKRRGSALAPFVPWLVAAIYILPTLSLGEDIWKLRHPQFVQMHLVWFMVMAACLFAGWKGVVAFFAIPFALAAIAYRCYFDLPADETLWAAWNLPIQQEWDVKSLFVWLMLFTLAASAFIRRGQWKWLHVVAPLLFVAGCVLAIPERDTRDQLQMERMVRYERDAKFDKVLEIAPDKARPERMESAWRILAMYRLDCIDRMLYRYPVSVSHHETREPEMLMGGSLLLFHYGLVLPARRWIFETASTDGWKPHDFRLLGEIALVTSEDELARRYFSEYARCPFRGDYAARRLAIFATEHPPAELLSDLVEVARMSEVWSGLSADSRALRYFPTDYNAERFIYGLFQRLRGAPPKMLRMLFASAILDGHPELLRKNRAALGELYPDGRIPSVFQEALK